MRSNQIIIIIIIIIIINKLSFTYSPLGQTFEKQTKAIEEQGEKQIKTITDHRQKQKKST